MKNLLFYIYIITLPLSSFSQKLIQGEPISDKSLVKDNAHILGTVNNNIYSMKVEVNAYAKGDVSLTKVDKDFNLEFNKTLDFKVPNFTNYLTHLHNEKIYLFYSDPKLGKIGYNCQVFDLDGTPIENIEILTIPIKGISLMSNYSKFSVSPNGSIVSIVVGSEDPDDMYHLDIMKLKLAEQVEKSIFETSIKYLGYESVYLGSLLVTNDEEFVGVVNKYIDDDVSNNFESELIILDAAAKLLKQQDIKMGDNYFSNFNIEVNENDVVKLSGSYLEREDNRKSFFKGFFITDFDMELLEFSNANFKPINSITSIYGDPDDKNKKLTFFGEFNVEVKENSDGSGYLIAERYSPFGSTSMQYLEVLVLPFSSSNEFGEFVYLPKSQRYVKEYPFSSTYFAYTKDNSLFVYFNADGTIEDSEYNSMVKYMMNPCKYAKTYQFEISPNGEKKLTSLQDNMKTKTYLAADRCFSENEVNYIVMITKKKFIFGRLE